MATDPEPQETHVPPAPDAGGDAEQPDEPLDADLSALAGEVQGLSARVADLTDRLTRARADYDNLHKRVSREAEAERDRVKARVLEGFLQVFEYGQMAAREAEKHPGALAEGVKMVAREFERLIEREGVQGFGAAGEPFDAARHEAVAEEPAAGVEAGHVSRVIQTGYLLGSRVLRYAKVAVAPAAGHDDQEEE